MLQILVCSDVHTYVDNIRLALRKIDRVDAILIAGDLEAEQDKILGAAGGIPCHMVCGNNDYYLNTDYPQELLIDISENPDNPLRGPAITGVRELTYESMPSSESESAYESSSSYGSMPSSGFMPSLPDANGTTGATGSRSGNTKKHSSFFGALLSFFSFGSIGFPARAEKRPPHITRRILMTHGKEYNVPDTSMLVQRARVWDADIVIFGHTHKYLDAKASGGKIRLLNPGCLIGDPNSSIRTYGIYEICSFAVLKIGYQGEISVQHLYL